MDSYHGTTIVSVRRGNVVALGGGVGLLYAVTTISAHSQR